MSTTASVRRGADGIARCWWCGDAPDYVHYHDHEWGVPVTDDQRLFEKLSLEGFQAGLSWITILRKRARFREVFADFDPERLARFGARDVRRLLNDAGLVRHRGKIEATLSNARAYLTLRASGLSLAQLVWSYAPESARAGRSRHDIPTTTRDATALSKELKRRGWRFVGPTTVYAFQQSMGLVNDHLVGCHRRAVVERLRERVRQSLR